MYMKKLNNTKLTKEKNLLKLVENSNNKLEFQKDKIKSKIVCGINIIGDGYDKKKKEVIHNTVCHRFIGFDTYEDLFLELQNKSNVDRCYFEVIKSHCKPYLDIEFIKKEYPDINETIIDKIIKDIIAIFKTKYRLTLEENDVIVSESHKYDDKKEIIKYSWHIIISPLKYNYVYQHNRFGNENTACDLLYHLFEMNKLYIEIIDMSVYSKEREMRLFLCNKNPLENRILKWNNYNIKKIDFKTYSRCFINYIDQNLETKIIETVYRDNPKKVFNTQKELEKIEKKKEEFKKNIANKNKILKEKNVFAPKEKKTILNKKKTQKTTIYIKSNKSYQYVEELVDNLSDHRSDVYEDWITVKWGLENQSVIDKQDYFNIFNNFSKKSDKYDEEEIKQIWNNTNQHNNGVTLGTIIFMLKKDNEEAYNYIRENYCKYDSQEIIKNFYNPNVKKYFKHIVEYEDPTTANFKIGDGQKGCFVKAEMGLGKSDTLLKQIKDHNNCILIKDIVKKVDNNQIFLNYTKEFKRILMISHRRSLASKFFGDLRQMKFDIYFDYKGYSNLNNDRLIIQLDSIYKVSLTAFDLVILDECESLFSHFKYGQMRHKNENIIMLETHIKQAGRVVLMDANLSIKSYEIMSKIDDLNKYTLIANKYKILKGWKMNFINGDEQVKMIDNDIKDGKKVCVASLSKNMINSHYGKIVPDHLLYSAETDSDKKFEDIMNINEAWKDRNIIYTPTISSGVSCTIKDQFINIYGYSNNKSALATDFFQMLRRVRHPINHAFNIYNEHVDYHSALLSLEEIEKYIKYSHLITDQNHLIADIPKFINNSKYEPIKNTAYYIHIYNILEEEINRCFFKNVLVYLAVEKGLIISSSENANKKCVELKKSIKEENIKATELVIDKLSKTNVIDNDEYNYINEIMVKEDKLTDEQKTQHKLKTLMNRFRYDEKRYNKLDSNDKKQLIQFMMEDTNHVKYINNCQINCDNIEKRIKEIQEYDKKRRDKTDICDYKPYYRMHFLIHNMLKLVGFDSIKSKEKILVNKIHTNMEKNKTKLLQIINEINYINGVKKKDKITLNVVGTIIKNFYGYAFVRTSIRIKDKKQNGYKIINQLKWGDDFFPVLLVVDKKQNLDEYAF
ncbi:superfamily II helicase [Catovirus CTV1]|uniref:Superfamily II helicase n=1 Tax=Catovirus CTV1 TaxID=1977631 RepID=A0A1V0S8D1_9VIRU|nr:superfamily II helicase [Catovirus CTV1]